MAASPPAPPIAQECVEGYLFVRDPPSLLLLRRPPARGGIWVPVSGKIEPTDASPAAAARREVLEETGFRSFVRTFPLEWAVVFDGPDGRPWRLEAFAFELDKVRSPELSAEHDAYDWVGPEVARSRLHYLDNREAVDRLIGRLDDPRPPVRVRAPARR